MQTECVTVTSYVLDQKKRYPGSSGELTILLNALLTAIKACAAAVRKAGIAKLYVQLNCMCCRSEVSFFLDGQIRFGGFIQYNR